MPDIETGGPCREAEPDIPVGIRPEGVAGGVVAGKAVVMGEMAQAMAVPSTNADGRAHPKGAAGIHAHGINGIGD